jgi:tRNA pseudouridine55 synthase
MDGVLVIDKPAGPTSFEVVSRVRALLGVKKAGHTGTLDPLATGVLPICLGEATKVAGFITQADKSYQAVIRLGVQTDTQDAAGRVIAEAPVPPLSAEGLEKVLAPFRGTFMQLPPMYSAVKVAGKRLYESARAGEEVAREKRQVTVHELSLMDFGAVELAVRVHCSKGFFVRALAHDIGMAMGCGAHLRALRRTASGPFSLQQSLSLDRLSQLCAEEGGRSQVAKRLLTVSEALQNLPSLTFAKESASKVRHGVPLETSAGPGRYRILDDEGTLLAIAEVTSGGRLRYLRVLAAAG